MKKMLLIGCVLAAGTFLYSQKVTLPGMGSTTITLSASQVNANTQFFFGNPEYDVTGFQLSFATNANPTYSATSANNHFTTDMITNFHDMVSGTGMQLQVNLKGNGVQSAVWQKLYTVQMTD